MKPNRKVTEGKISEGKPKTTKRSTKKKTKRPKTSKPSTTGFYDKTFSGPFRSLKNLLSWSANDASKKRNEWLAEKLFKWVEKPDALSLVGFTIEYAIPYTHFLKLAENDPQLDAVRQYAKLVMGIRKQKYATFKEYNCNPAVILQTIRLYHPDYREAYNEEQEHKKEQSAAAYLVEYFKDKNMELPDLDEAKRKTTTPDK